MSHITIAAYLIVCGFTQIITFKINLPQVFQ